ncbi:Hypothetical predicted protein, partial [Paramuricea clavata]
MLQSLINAKTIVKIVWKNKAKKVLEEPKSPKCLSSLARGKNSYKGCHWNQRHKDEKNTKFQTLIVPKNHIKAQELLKHNNVRPAEDEAVYICIYANNSSDDDNADNLEDCDARSQISQNSPTPSVDTQPTASDTIEDTVNEILVKLDELTLVSTPNKTTDHTSVTVNIEDIKAAHNMLELEKITIETLNDGCRITCVTCKEFIKAMPHMN